jgi:sugar phosphate isomerase/epimerase
MSEQTSPSRRSLALAWLTVADAPPLEHIDAAAAAGFDAVGLRLIAPSGALKHPVVGNAPLVRQLRARLADTGMRVLDIETLWIRPDFRVADVAATLEIAALLGAGHLLTMGGDPDPARLADSFAALCESAAAHGIAVGMELAAYTTVRNLAEAEALVRSAGRGNAALVIDALHLARSGGLPSDVARLAPSLIAYGQLCDARGPRPAVEDLRTEALERRYLPGHGELPLRELVAVLPAAAALAVEAPGPELTGLSYLERARHAAQATRRLLSEPA